MIGRKKLTLPYEYNENWIGGTYYILNLIKTLNLLDDGQKPDIVICYKANTPVDAIEKIKYPYVSYVKMDSLYNFVVPFINKITYLLTGRTFFEKELPIKTIDNLYPVTPGIGLNNAKNPHYWIPDFQDKHLPQFFSAKELAMRDKHYKLVKKSNKPVVFSSENAWADYDKFYPGNTNKKKVLKFVSLLGDSYKALKIAELKEKFNIAGQYFIVSNQIWMHKNHQIVIEAMKILKNDKLPQFQIVVTGKEHDFRNPDYANELKASVKESGLDKDILFLGFIGRDEQLQLMKNSIAIIQPSLFEGWSTVVEDTKAMNHYILISDIPLHREQISENCQFFDPANAVDLASKIKVAAVNGVKVVPINYEQKIKECGQTILSLVN